MFDKWPPLTRVCILTKLVIKCDFSEQFPRVTDDHGATLFVDKLMNLDLRFYVITEEDIDRNIININYTWFHKHEKKIQWLSLINNKN